MSDLPVCNCSEFEGTHHNPHCPALAEWDRLRAALERIEKRAHEYGGPLAAWITDEIRAALADRPLDRLHRMDQELAATGSVKREAPAAGCFACGGTGMIDDEPSQPCDCTAVPASEAPEITQLCPKCSTGWTARELLPCPECGYTFPSQPDGAPESEEMRLLTALVSVKPGTASFDAVMSEATRFVTREKLSGDCWHCGGHPAGLGDGRPCPTCGSPGMHASGCAVNNGPALPVGECDCKQPLSCDDCWGSGKIGGETCRACGGTGKEKP